MFPITGFATGHHCTYVTPWLNEHICAFWLSQQLNLTHRYYTYPHYISAFDNMSGILNALGDTLTNVGTAAGTGVASTGAAVGSGVAGTGQGMSDLSRGNDQKMLREAGRGGDQLVRFVGSVSTEASQD